MSELQPGDQVLVREWNGSRFRGEFIGWRGTRQARANVQVNGVYRVVKRASITRIERATSHPGELVRAPDYTLRAGEPQPKVLPLRDEAYLAWVRRRPCKFCGATEGVQASHHGRGGMATKASDDTVLPACMACHNRWHSAKYSPSEFFDDLTAERRRDVLRVLADQCWDDYVQSLRETTDG